MDFEIAVVCVRFAREQAFQLALGGLRFEARQLRFGFGER
jgi:hypothetical protein